MVQENTVTHPLSPRHSINEDEIEKRASVWLDGTGRPSLQKTKLEKVPLPAKGERNILVTSALPYVNNVPHLGTIIGCVLSADVYARYCRLRSYNVLYICGTDEYGTATETKAIEEGLTPQQICDKYFKVHKESYDWFEIQFDYFGRTTTEKQTAIAQEIFMKLRKNGFTSCSTMDQLYCISCKRFLADRFVEGTCPSCAYEDARGDQCDKCSRLINAIDLKQPRCKLCQSRPELKSSEHIYLNLPELQPALSDYLESQWTRPDCKWSPNAIAITKSWLKEGLKERCITRDLKWGTPVPLLDFKEKVFYVWFDAPIGYISITACYTDKWKEWWENPEEVELYNFVGKDNVPFHGVIFPACLLGTGDKYTILNHLSATEYLNYEDTKFSKSRGVGVFGTDAKETGIPADVWRFYLLSQRPESQDANFNWSDFALKVNGELLNNLGNFINRALSFVQKFFDNVIPAVELKENDKRFISEVSLELEDYMNLLERVKLRDGLKSILNISHLGNLYIQSSTPWAKVKEGEAGKLEGGTVVSVAANVVALLSVMLHPYMPETSRAINQQLNLPGDSVFELKGTFVQLLPTGHRIGQVSPLFKKLEQSDMEEFRVRFAGLRSKEPTPVMLQSNLTKEALESAIKEQGDKVRNLKTSKAEKAVIDVEVQKLLELKKEAGAAPAASQSNVKSKKQVANADGNPKGKEAKKKPGQSNRSPKKENEKAVSKSTAVATMIASHCGEGDANKRIYENSRRIAEELSLMEARCAEISKPIVAEEDDRLRKENEQLKSKVNGLVNRLNDLESRRGVKQVSKPSLPANHFVTGHQTAAVTQEPQPVPVQQPKATTVKEPEAKDSPEQKKAPDSKKGKGEGKNKSKSAASTGGAGGEEKEPDVSRLDMRVGHIVKAEKHPDADALYVEEVDLGEGKNRTVVSGLVKFVPLEQMQNRLAVFLCNLKPAKMRGIESQGMLMCASTPEKVEILDPPAGAAPGDRVTCPYYPGDPDQQLNPKKKTWEQIQPHLKVEADGFAAYKKSYWEIENKGKIKAPSLKDVPIK